MPRGRVTVVASAALPIDIRPILGDEVSLVAPAVGSMSREELLPELAHARALISLLDVAVDEALLEAAPKLRLVANFAVGYDNVDVAAATRRRVLVSNTPDVLTNATADLAFALLLAAARRLLEGDRLARSGAWTGWKPDLLLGRELAGATLGLVGFGRIAQAVARRARGFDMKIVYAAPRPRPEASALEARQVPLDTLWSSADFISLHCPLTPATTHLVDTAALRAMKSTAILVNTARGGCIHEGALAEALSRGEIAGAGLDVFENEPAIHPALVASDRVVLAPHVGSATTYARTRMAEICAEAVRSVARGEAPATLVNPEAL